MKTDDAPWFRKAPVGVNQLNRLMKTMAQKDGLGLNFTNHNGRKTVTDSNFCQQRRAANRYLYATVRTQKRLKNRKVRYHLTETTVASHSLWTEFQERAPQSGSSIPEKRKHDQV